MASNILPEPSRVIAVTGSLELIVVPLPCAVVTGPPSFPKATSEAGSPRPWRGHGAREDEPAGRPPGLAAAQGPRRGAARRAPRSPQTVESAPAFAPGIPVGPVDRCWFRR